MTMMIHGTILSLTLLPLAILGGATDPHASADQDDFHDPVDPIQWTGSYTRALTMARETGKPILLEFRCQP